MGPWAVTGLGSRGYLNCCPLNDWTVGLPAVSRDQTVINPAEIPDLGPKIVPAAPNCPPTHTHPPPDPPVIILPTGQHCMKGLRPVGGGQTRRHAWNGWPRNRCGVQCTVLVAYHPITHGIVGARVLGAPRTRRTSEAVGRWGQPVRELLRLCGRVLLLLRRLLLLLLLLGRLALALSLFL